MFKVLSLFVLLFSCSAYARTDYVSPTVSLHADLRQGGLMEIEYDEGQTKSITINGKPIALDGDGIEYYGIDRNAKKLDFKQTLKSGKVIEKTYPVKDQHYIVQHIKGVKKEYVTPPKEQLDRIARESKIIRASRTTNDKKYFNTIMPEFALPAIGRTTGVFGSSRTYNGVEKSWHKGYDIANKRGTLITAPLKGKVVLAMKDTFYNGNIVIIDHGKKIYSIYIHMCDIIAKKGDVLNVGDPIGKIGTTGRSTGPHLHWGIYVGQKAIDPALLLKKEIKKES